jgi:hypothetical protein
MMKGAKYLNMGTIDENQNNLYTNGQIVLFTIAQTHTRKHEYHGSCRVSHRPSTRPLYEVELEEVGPWQ